MRQGTLPFQFKAEKKSSGGSSALTGLSVFLAMVHVMELGKAIKSHVRVKEFGQGWDDVQMITSLIMLNLSSGESVSDIRTLESDMGFRQMFNEVVSSGKGRKQRARERSRWRRNRQRALPSESSMFRYLSKFVNPGQEDLRKERKAFIPKPSDWLRGLGKVNAYMLSFINRHTMHEVATLDMDATLIETYKQQAKYCYNNCKAYQPLTTFWAEMGMIVHSEFRDGNVPAGFEQLRVFKESLEYLPANVKKVMLRSDTAGYQKDLLQYCAEGSSERFGEIEFAVGVPMKQKFRSLAAKIPEDQWHPLPDRNGNYDPGKGQQWAEVDMVPSWVDRKKDGPDYRFIGIRERLWNPPLMEIDEEDGAEDGAIVPMMQSSAGTWYKIRGVVTNRDIDAVELIHWYRERCGRGELVHAEQKVDLAGGRLPSGKFGSNAAWWATMVLAYNLYVAVKRLALGGKWISKRLKAIRFHLINIAGRVGYHSRKLVIRIDGDHASFQLLLRAFERIQALAHAPPT